MKLIRSVNEGRDRATKSLLAAREAYQDHQTGLRIKPRAKLGKEYFEKSLPVVKHRNARSGGVE